jgi:ketosteroid isomerase-like protein
MWHLIQTAGFLVLAFTTFLARADLSQPIPTAASHRPAEEECRVNPRTKEAVLQLVGPRSATPDLPAAPPDDAVAREAPGTGASTPRTERPDEPLPPAAQLQGNDVDPATLQDVASVLRAYVTCFNSGDNLRLLALMTDDYVVRLLSRPREGQRMTEEDIELILSTTEPPTESERLGTPEIEDAAVLMDGSIGVIVVFPSSFVQGDEQPYSRELFVFERVEDRWLIDEIQSLESRAVPSSTPSR